MADDDLQNFLLDIAKRNRCNDVEDLYATIGYGGLFISKLMPKIKEDYAKIVKASKPLDLSNTVSGRKTTKSSEGVVVEGIDNCLIKLSRCCTPIPGDDIIGFITRGHGVSIHKKDCNNVPLNLQDAPEPERWVSAYWETNTSSRFDSTLHILSLNRDGLVADLSILLGNMHVSVHAISAKELKDGNCTVTITIGVESKEHLDNVILRIKKLQGVFFAERVSK